tara:strand:+ start:4259 stop:4372 length:114 start_codon:yes stop_codon:yes gene_type:complete
MDMTKELSQEQKQLIKQAYQCLDTIQRYLDNVEAQHG